MFDAENHTICDNIEKLVDYPENLYISGGAGVYAMFFNTPALRPDVVVDCVYGGEIIADAKDLIDVNKKPLRLIAIFLTLP